MSDIVSEIAEWVAIAKGDKCALCKGTGKIRGGHVTCPKCGGNKAVAKDANESLATILRHDEDHDNWHRMHGDEPCTSEADCAEKRAKYAEVKAEVAKSADEILAEIEQWRIQKATDGRYTEITVSEPNLTDWQHQGWNGPGKDGVLNGDDSSDESSSENMYGEDL